ncbi:unnamed protein product [Brassica napus]|uniref:(rape) hypothetical protein n=1 Tax=Brassica napus TaxID=3708 RepID=A0A816ISH6_BRANA|nr:unnamed protein product [Brassica napus]
MDYLLLRRQENLSEMEQQLKKAEAAQRRKVQIEKAARESEAEAIRKILGQDSSRKKREDKIKKRLDELAQEKAAHEERASTSYIRTIMGPNGTTVSFPIDKVPSLFDPKPSGFLSAVSNVTRQFRSSISSRLHRFRY